MAEAKLKPRQQFNKTRMTLKDCAKPYYALRNCSIQVIVAQLNKRSFKKNIWVSNLRSKNGDFLSVD